MFNTRLFSLIRKEFIQIIRDPRTLMLTFLMPVMQLLLLGYAATNDVRNVSLAVFDQDKSASSRALVDAYRAAAYFQVNYDVANSDELRALIDRGDARAGILIPPGYGASLAKGKAASIGFVIDGSDPTVATAALSAATFIGQSMSTTLAVERLAVIPAMIGMILQFMTTILTSTAVVRERERGTIEQLIVTPIKAWELVVGKLTPYVIIGFIDTLEILVAGVLIFGVPINGSLPLMLAHSGLFLVSTLGLGLFISTISNTQQEAMMTAMFTMLPTIFLSGFFFPLAAMPPVLQWISYVIPLRYFLIVVRGIILKGVGVEALWPQVIALSIFAVVIMGSAALRFRKRLD